MEGDQRMATEAFDELGQKVSDYWSTQRVWQLGRGMQWLELEAVQRRIAAKVSGDPVVDWLEYVTTRYYAHRQPVARCLSLGCGKGSLERTLASAEPLRGVDDRLPEEPRVIHV